MGTDLKSVPIFLSFYILGLSRGRVAARLEQGNPAGLRVGSAALYLICNNLGL